MKGPFPSRRSVLAGGGLLVSFTMARASAAGSASQAPSLPGDLARHPWLDSWIAVDADGKITVFTGKVELGQGVKTAFIQLAAEELDIEPAAVTLVTADTARTPDEGVTAGSHSMQDSGAAIRGAAANVRLLLAQAAATRWRLPLDQVSTRSGAAHAPDGRALGYGALAAELSLHMTARPDAPLKAVRERTLIGRDWPRVDIPAKLTGGPAYVQDLRPEGMFHARVARGPSYGTRMKAADVAAAAGLPGVVKVVQDGGFTAVVAEREWTAIVALRRLQASGWERPGPPLPTGDLHAALRAMPSQPLTVFAYPGVPAGARRITARYTRPYLMHGPVGPSCAVALWRDDNLTVWTHSQGVGPLRGALADLFHISPEKVRCIHVEGSGCYGHNGADDVAADAAVAARATPGRPVRLQWMREQEHGWEPLGAAMTVDLAAELDASGRVACWRYEMWSNEHNSRPNRAGGLLAGQELDPAAPPQPSRPIPMPEGGASRNANPLYAFPNAQGLYHFIPTAPIRVSALRSLGAHMNVFAIESFLDELAAAAGADPVAFRLAQLQDERAKAVITRAATRFGWDTRPRGKEGRGCGFAFARYKNLASYCAVAMEVEVARETGRLRARRVVAAVDSGETVNPDGLRNQIEGAIVQSLSWTTREQATFDSGHRTSFDWHTYPILRFEDVPDSVEVEVIDRPGLPFLGAGEAGQGPTAAATANALADALGVRVRDMPLSPERIRAAMAT
jgi:CO/xanthine dehydrogenase Mo-binding subunit